MQSVGKDIKHHILAHWTNLDVEF